MIFAKGIPYAAVTGIPYAADMRIPYAADTAGIGRDLCGIITEICVEISQRLGKEGDLPIYMDGCAAVSEWRNGCSCF